MKSNLEREIKSIIPWFRNLDGWVINVDTKTKKFNQTLFDVTKETATIYRRTADISDRIYAFHEVLHVAFIASFRRQPPYSKSELDQREEILIEDLCAFLFLNIK